LVYKKNEIMAICKKRKLLFVHIPKCAGGTVEQWFLHNDGDYTSNVYPNYNERNLLGVKNDLVLNHLSIIEYTKFVNINDYYKFAIVRNPLERLKSAYKYQVPYIRSKSKDKISTFDEFINVIDSTMLEKYHFNELYNIPMYKFLCDDKNNLLVNTFKYEEFDKIKEFFKKYSDIPLTHHHKSESLNNINVSSKSKKKINNLYDIDFKLFGYEKLI